MNWRSACAAELADTLIPALPGTIAVVAVAADDDGYAVRLSDHCPLDGRFALGSMTKTLTGIVLASLVGDGTVSLEDPVGRWLDAGTSADVTLGQLATHTSGLPRLSPGHVSGGPDPYGFLTARAAEQELRAAPAAPRGAEWDYSNFGFQVLSLALERASGVPYGALLEQSVFGPLDMTCSGVPGRGGGRLIQGHREGRPVLPWTHHLCGAGGAEASAEDLARYLAACLSPPDSAIGRAIRTAQQPHFRIDPQRSSGLGWALGPAGYLGHDGATAGFRSMLGISHLTGRGAAVVVSDRSARGLGSAVRRVLEPSTG